MSGMNSHIIMPAFLLLYIITHHVNHVNHGFKNNLFKTLDFMNTMNEFKFMFLNIGFNNINFPFTVQCTPQTKNQ